MIHLARKNMDIQIATLIIWPCVELVPNCLHM